MCQVAEKTANIKTGKKSTKSLNKKKPHHRTYEHQTVPSAKKKHVGHVAPHPIVRLLCQPVWYGALLVHAWGTLWIALCAFIWAPIINTIIDLVTFKQFSTFLERNWNPPDATYKPNSIVGRLAPLVLNKPVEHGYYLWAIMYQTIGISITWAGIIYMGYTGVGSWYGPLMLHMYYIGALWLAGINELHYVGHLQVSSSTTSHVFKYEILNHLCGLIIEPAQGFVPQYWLNQHVLIHHKKNLGPDDIQGLSYFERNFTNFGWFVADMPLQWYIRGPLHHHRFGNTKLALWMVFTELLHLAIGVALSVYLGTMTGIYLVFIPILTRSMGYAAGKEYSHHAIVDGRAGDPEDSSNNTCIILQPTPRSYLAPGLRAVLDNFEERWHAVHHHFPRFGMINQGTVANKVKCKFVFDTDFVKFKQAIILAEVEKLATWWIPGYSFAGEVVSEQSKLDAQLDHAGKVKLMKSFLLPAISEEEMGDWIKEPSFPHFMMKPSPLQEVNPNYR